MQFFKQLQNKFGPSPWIGRDGHREPNKDGDFYSNNNNSRVSIIINTSNFPSHDVLSPSLSSSSSPALALFSHREIPGSREIAKTEPVDFDNTSPSGSQTLPDDEISGSCAFTNSKNGNSNYGGVHSSINSDVEITPAFSNSLSSPSNNFLRHNSNKQSSNNEAAASSPSSSLCQVEPVILSLTPLSKSEEKDYAKKVGVGSGGRITNLFHSSQSRRISSAPHDTSFNAKLSKSKKGKGKIAKGNFLDPSDEFFKDGIDIDSNFGRDYGTSEAPVGINNNNIRCFSSTSDYPRHSPSHLREKSLPFGLDNNDDGADDDDPLIQFLVQRNGKEELPVRKKGIEKGTKDKTDERIDDDDEDNFVPETNNRITKCKNNIFLASGTQARRVSSSSSARLSRETGPTPTTSASVEEQHQQFSTFPGSREVDGLQSGAGRRIRRRSIPANIYSTAGSQIWDRLLNDNPTREIHRTAIERERRKEYERKVGRVDSNGTNASVKIPSLGKGKEEKVAKTGKASSHSKAEIAENFPSHPDPNPILSKSERELDLVARLNSEEGTSIEPSRLTGDSHVGGVGVTTRDQFWGKSSSRNTTFTGDRPSSSSSSRSTFSDCISSSSSNSSFGFGSEAELGSIVIVATGEEGEANSAPVVAYSSSSLNSANSVLPSYGSASAIITEGFSCSHKVTQRKKWSYYSRNPNSNVNNSKGSNSNNSESNSGGVPGENRGKAKYSIIHCLPCTKGFHLLDIRKKLFAQIFHCCGAGGGSLSKHKDQHPPKRKFRESSRRIGPSLSISTSTSYTSSSLPTWSSYNQPKRRRRRGRGKGRLVRQSRDQQTQGDNRPLTRAQLLLWATMDHEDLIRELPTIEKLSNQERLRLAHKRRMLQLKKFQQYEKDLNSNSKKHRGDSDLIRRNLPGKNYPHGPGVRKGSRRIRFRNSIMLLEAAGRNDVEEVRLLLESGVNPDVANEDGLTALHQCCIDDNEEMMKLLLDYGANVNAEDSEKWTPLHAAATCGHLHLVQYLIARGANLLAVNAEGNMPYDICDDETTLDYIESEMAKRGVTQELIEEIRALPETRMLQEIQRVHAQGGDLELRDVDGATPLHIASANGYYRVAEFLLDNHAATDVQDKDCWQPIHAAACWGHLDVLELLVQNGADLDARTKNNETPYAICEDPEIKERIIQLRTEQQTKRQNEGRKRPTRTHSTNSRTQSIRRTSQRDKGLTSKRDAADEAQMLRAREEVHKENSPSPTSDATAGTKNNAPSVPTATTTSTPNGNPVNGVAHPLNGDTQNNITQNGNGSSEEDPEERSYPAAMLGRDSVGNMKMKQDEMNRLREIAVKSGAMNHNNHLNNQNVLHNNANPGSGGVKMNNLHYNEQNNGSLMKNQTNIHKNLNTSSNGTGANGPVSVLSSPDDNGNLLPKPEINPSVDNKVSLGGGLGSGVSLSGSRDNLVGLSNSAGNSTIDIHVSVTINTNSPVSTLTNGGGGGTGNGGPGSHGLNGSIIPMSPGSSIFTPPGTLSDLKKQRSLIRTSSNPLTNGGMNDSMTKYHPPASPTMSLRRYVGDPAETVGDYGDGGKRCCVIV